MPFMCSSKKNFRKKILSYLKSAPSNSSKFKISCKTGTLRIRDQKWLILCCFLRQNFEKLSPYLKAESLNSAKSKVPRNSKRPSNLGPKILYLRFLGYNFEKL